MIGWAVFAVVILGLLVVVVAVWLWSEHLAVRRRAQAIAKNQPEYSVAAIRLRIAEEESAEQVAAAQTEVLPVVPAAEMPTEVVPAVPADDAATEVLPAVLPLRRKRRYVQRPTPYPRNRDELPAPDRDLMHRVLDGLKQLD